MLCIELRRKREETIKAVYLLYSTRTGGLLFFRSIRVQSIFREYVKYILSIYRVLYLILPLLRNHIGLGTKICQTSLGCFQPQGNALVDTLYVGKASKSVLTDIPRLATRW